MKFGSREICDVVFKAKSNTKLGNHTFKVGEPVIYLDTATTSSMETAATTVYAQGGKGNSRLIAWEGEKTVTFTVEDALISPKGLAILSGAGLINAGVGGTTIKAHTTQTVTVGNTNSGADGTNSTTLAYSTLDLDGFELPAGETDADVHVYGSREADAGETNTNEFPAYAMLLDNNGEMSGVAVEVKIVESTLTNNGVLTKKWTMQPAGTVTASNFDKITKLFAKGEAVMLDYYTVYESDAVQIDITPDQFAGYYYMEASTLFRRQVDGKDLPAEFIIPTAKIQSNFTFTMASTGDPSTFTFTMDAMPGYVKGDKTKKVLAAIQILGADDNFDLPAANPDYNEDIDRYKYQANSRGRYLGTDKTKGDNDSTQNSITAIGNP